MSLTSKNGFPVSEIPDLLEYARERAAREACEAATDYPLSDLLVMCNLLADPDQRYEGQVFRRTRNGGAEMIEVSAATPTEAYLSLLDVLRKDAAQRIERALETK
jgi:hypothetical protein